MSERYSEALDLHVLGDYRADRKATAAAFASTDALKVAYPAVLSALREECSRRSKDVETWGLPMSLGYLRGKAPEELATTAEAAAPAAASGRPLRKPEKTPS
jgi:hypothetical protein